jgi:phosphoglycolate phosphatase
MQNLLKSDYQAFIFDMDGTIVSTVEDICDAVNYSLIRHDFMPISYEECTTYLGNGSVKLIQRAMHHERQELFQSVFDTYYNYHLDHYQVQTKSYDGLLDALAYAKSKGVLLFIYTNKPEKIALEIEKNLFPKGTFEKMVGIPLGGVTKPDPVAFINAAKDYHIDYQKVAYFGDSTTDIQTAYNLKVRTICSVLWGYQSEEHLKSYSIQPDFYLRETKEIEHIVDFKLK